MSAARKKVVVRCLDGELYRGYLPSSEVVTGLSLELLLPDGHALEVPWHRVKYIAYVRDFNFSDSLNPERLGLRRFPSKPRGVGLWVAVRLEEEDTLEGLVPNGLPLLDSILLNNGVFLEPPDRNGNTQRLFVPRSALAGFNVLGVAGAKAAARRDMVDAADRQGGLFDSSGED